MKKLKQPLTVLIVILFTAVIGLQGLSNHAAVPIRKPLSSFPRQINGMIGRDTGIAPDILAVLGSGEFLSRVYQGPSSSPLFLYIAYYSKQERGDAIHSPKNCLPGSGWQPVLSDRVRIDLPQGQTIVANRYLVQKDINKQLVLYWYQSHGRTLSSEYWGKIYAVLDAIWLGRTDAAVIRVSTPIEARSEALAQEDLESFIKAFYPLLADYLPE